MTKNKISSVTQKVLCSALSAAVVVAFAPAVAMADTGDAVKVAVDLDGGVTLENTTFDKAKVGDTITLPAFGTVDKAGFAPVGYQVTVDGVDAVELLTEDNDADGKSAGAEDEVAGLQYTIDDVKDVAVKAVYDLPSVTLSYVTDTYTGVVATISNDDANKLAEGVTYNFVMVNGEGDRVVKTTVAKPAEGNSDAVAIEAVFGTDEGQISPDFLTGGTWKATITNPKGEVVVESKLDMVKLNIVDGTTGSTTGSKVVDTYVGVAGDELGWDDASKAYVDADGYAFTTAASQKLKAGTYTVKQIDTAKALVVDAGGYYADGQDLCYSVTAKTAGDTLSYELVDPNNAVIFSTSTKAFAGDNNTVDVTFDQTSSAYAHVKEGTSIMAGDYVLRATETDEVGDVVATGKAKITITEFKYEAAEGVAFSKDFAKTADVFVDDATDYYENSLAAIDAVATAKSGYVLAENWDLNGNGAYDADTNPYLEGKTNTLTAKASVEDRAKFAADPTIESASYDATKKEWTIKLACATEGVTMVWTQTTPAGSVEELAGTTYDPTKGIVIDNTADVYVQAKSQVGHTDTNKSSRIVKLTCDTDAWDALVSGTADIQKKVGLSTTKWAEIAGVAAAVEAGQKAVDEAGYKTAKDMNALLNTQAKGVYDAVKTAAEAELGKYANGAYVVVGEKAYVLTAKQIEGATKGINNAAKTLSEVDTEVLAVSDYKTAVKATIKAVNDTLLAATEAPATAADVAAAETVSATLAAVVKADAVTAENAVEVKASAEAALAAYANLTATQKKLVTSVVVDDVNKTLAAANVEIAKAEAAKAEEEAKKAAEEAAAALKAAQDKAAALSAKAKVKGSTYKIKAKKSKTLSFTKSASGAKVTLKQTAGTKYAKVSGTKITLKKAAKVGKSYTIKVKAVCGAYTTAAVAFKVKVTK